MYRKYKLDYLENKSDVDFMYEVTKRRFNKKINTNDTLPNLYIVDGGILQINAALKALTELNINDLVTLIGLKKNNNHRTESIVLIDGSEIKLDKHSDLFAFLSNMQDEVHRYAITYFRNKRSKSQFVSILDKVEGIGEKYRNKIIEFFPNIIEIDKIPLDNLIQIIPEKVAIKLKKEIRRVLDDKNNSC